VLLFPVNGLPIDVVAKPVKLEDDVGVVEEEADNDEAEEEE
jgi:hypothetical protein